MKKWISNFASRRLIRWSVIVLAFAIAAIIYIFPDTYGFYEPVDSGFHKPPAQTSAGERKQESLENTSVKTGQLGSLIEPEFSVSLFVKDQATGFRLCLTNKNPSSTSTLRSGDTFKMLFPSDCGPIRLVPDSISVKSSTINPTDFHAIVNSNQINLIYIGQDKKFSFGDNCCLEVTLTSFNGSTPEGVQFSSPSGDRFVKPQPTYVVLPSPAIFRSVKHTETMEIPPPSSKTENNTHAVYPNTASFNITERPACPGCCSHHGGMRGYENGRVICRDGTVRPSTVANSSSKGNSASSDLKKSNRKGEVFVHGYYRKNGTYVHSYHRHKPHMKESNRKGEVFVHGYYRKNGTYVHSYHRHKPHK